MSPENKIASFPIASVCPASLRRRFHISSWLLVVAAMIGVQRDCFALPSFARQLNLQCIACHTEFPVLTDMGRQFKLSGYTMSADSADQTALPPVAVMLQPSFTRTQAGQDGGAAPGFGNNNNYAMNQVSLFYAGRLFGPFAKKWFGADSNSPLNKIGIFSQTTYDGVGKAWSWDNTELRYADTGTLGEHAVTYGAYLNNNPTMQDPWNSTPAWGFPFSSSGLAPTPAATALIDGGLGGEVAGLGAYALFDNSLYFDAGAYRMLGSRYQRGLGVTPTGETQVTGLAPYWRVAYTRPIAGATWELGAFGLAAKTYPGRDSSAGNDKVTDVGLDSQFQKTIENSDITALVSVIHGHNNWTASEALGDTANTSGSLTEYKATVDYLWHKTYGFAAQVFSTNGTNDALAYASSQTGSPNSNGYVLQANYLPINQGTGPAFWPRSNVKLSLQYVMYNRFDGSKTNIDGAGRRAKDNNTLYLEAWVMF